MMVLVEGLKNREGIIREKRAIRQVLLFGCFSGVCAGFCLVETLQSGVLREIWCIFIMPGPYLTEIREFCHSRPDYPAGLFAGLIDNIKRKKHETKNFLVTGNTGSNVGNTDDIYG
jgi:hypothetical protein